MLRLSLSDQGLPLSFLSRPTSLSKDLSVPLEIPVPFLIRDVSGFRSFALGIIQAAPFPLPYEVSGLPAHVPPSGFFFTDARRFADSYPFETLKIFASSWRSPPSLSVLISMGKDLSPSASWDLPGRLR